MKLEVVELGVHRDVATGNVVHVAFLKTDGGEIIEAQLTKESFDLVWSAVGTKGEPAGGREFSPEPGEALSEPPAPSPPSATYVDRAVAEAGGQAEEPGEPPPDEADVDEDGFGPSDDDE